MAESHATFSEASEHKPLTKFVLASYGAPAMPLALSGLPIAVYLPVIYADSESFCQHILKIINGYALE